MCVVVVVVVVVVRSSTASPACFADRIAVIAGRFCVPVPRGQSGPVTCCLPCPREDWVYRDSESSRHLVPTRSRSSAVADAGADAGFFAMTRIANYINVVGLVCCFALLLSFAVLPLERTHRHYLSVCLILGIVVMHVSLPTKPRRARERARERDIQTADRCPARLHHPTRCKTITMLQRHHAKRHVYEHHMCPVRRGAADRRLVCRNVG